MVGLEALVVSEAVHDFGVESDDFSAITCEFSRVPGEFLASLFYFRRELAGFCGGRATPGDARLRRRRVGGEFGETYLDEFFGGVHSVVGLEAFVVEIPICDLHEELDDAPAVVGYFGDYPG